MSSFWSEKTARRAAYAKGFSVHEQAINNGEKFTKRILDPEVPTEPFFVSENWCDIIQFLWRVPSIKGRQPRPSVKDLTFEAARARGYGVGGFGNDIAIFDPDRPVHERTVARALIWYEALNAVLRLPSKAPKPQQPKPVIVEQPRPPLIDQRYLNEPGLHATKPDADYCDACGAAKCDRCHECPKCLGPQHTCEDVCDLCGNDGTFRGEPCPDCTPPSADWKSKPRRSTETEARK